MLELIKYIIIFSLTSSLFAQFISTADTFYFHKSYIYQIKHPIVDTSSFEFWVNGIIIPKQNFRFNLHKFQFTLANINLNLYDTLVIKYNYFPINIPLVVDNKDNFIIVDQYDTTKDYTKIQRNINYFNPKEYLGDKINTSGYLYRGFSFATNQDFQLNSGLRLEMNGYLTDDIYLSAVLNDENTPIMPEGNTERLQEFDKVYVNIKHKKFNLTLGDFDYNKNYNTFFVLNRKLQGFTGNYFDKDNNIEISYANQRGKFYNYTFNTSAQFQGPYQIYGENGQKDILIVAGSEKVFLDGKELKRGENNDYIIDYSNAKIIFTPKIILTNYSRISIDFEYTSLKYQRNFFTTNYDYKSEKNNLLFNFAFVREADNYNNSINFDLSESDKQIIKNAGNDIFKAIKTGIILVNDSSRGYYKKIDTTLNGDVISFYRFSPNDSTAKYIVNFSFVGDGNGDYIKKSYLEYVYVGKNKGNYLPIVFLPIPERKYLASAGIKYNFTDNFDVGGNFAFSSYDANTIAENNSIKNGLAFEIVSNLKDYKVYENFFFSSSTKHRFISKEFSSVTRYNSVNFNDNYNLNGLNTKFNDENLTELQLSTTLQSLIKIQAELGNYNKGNLKSFRQNYNYWQNFWEYLELNFNSNFVKSNDGIRNSNLKDIFVDFSTNKKNNLVIGLSYKNLYRNVIDKNKIYQLPFEKYQKYSIYNYFTGSFYKLQYNFEITQEQGLLANKILQQSNNIIHNFNASVYGQNYTISNLLIFRNTKYSKEFRANGYSDYNSLTAKNNSFIKLFNFAKNDIYYEITTQKMQTYQKIFIKVKKGTGNYSYLGDINNNGVFDENEFVLNNFDGDYILEIIPITNLQPVTDLKSSYRLKLDFRELENNDYLKYISTETYFRIEENSKDPKKENLYLIRVNNLLNENFTVMGNQIFIQDINLLEYSDEISFKYRYTSKKGLNNFVMGKENSRYIENSYRVFFKLVDEITIENEIKFFKDNFLGPKNLNRSRYVNGKGNTTIFSYRPIKEFLLDLTNEFEEMSDKYPLKPYTIKKNMQKMGISYSFIKNASLRLEFERTEYNINNKQAIIPIDLLSSYQIGKNYIVRFNSNYNLLDAGIITVNYQGRKVENNVFIHYFSAEVRVVL
ncbi:MAG TPA: hypothetical protein PLU62_03500 [Ignavibacteriales bacterium]|nr:hypothetical protein [Ignavibacteriales bacterium]HPP33004.1 hypothetical protein [Ignavibacteriales bacterium]